MKNSFIKDKVFYIYLAIVFAILAIQFKFELATDTYSIIDTGLDHYSSWVFSNGRFLSSLFIKIIVLLGGNILAFYYTSLLMCIIFLAGSLYLTHIILKEFFNKTTAIILSALIIFNPMVCEYFMFIEKGFFVFAIFLSILALYLFNKFLKNKNFLLLPLSSVLLFLAFGIYQPIPSTFAVLATMLIVLIHKDMKTFAKNLGYAISIYGTAAFLEFLFTKLFSNGSRGGSIYIQNLKTAFLFGGNLLYLLLYVAGASILLLISFWVASKINKAKRKKLTLLLFLKSLTLCFAALISTFYLFVATNPTEVWFPFRIIYPLGVCCGALIAVFTNELKDTKSVNFRIFNVVTIVIICLTIIFTEFIMFNRIKNNKEDYNFAVYVHTKIVDYESLSGQKVENISIYYDASKTDRYVGVFGIFDSNKRAISTNYSDVSSINYYNNTNYKRTLTNNNIFEEHFKNKNWDKLDDEQFYFEGNTLHLCVY